MIRKDLDLECINIIIYVLNMNLVHIFFKSHYQRLQKMGWSEEKGLGREENGDIINLFQYSNLIRMCIKHKSLF